MNTTHEKLASDRFSLVPDTKRKNSCHLLSLPLESRLNVYAHILADIQNERRPWQAAPRSSYDGVRNVCKQLWHETNMFVFQNRITSQGLSVFSNMYINKTTVLNLRSLYLQIPLNLPHRYFLCLAQSLNRFQLSLQELHLIFVGPDLFGDDCYVYGCGNHDIWNVDSSDLLRNGDQEITKRYILLGQLPNLQALRILQIKNMHCPVLKGAIFLNKPYLQALSVSCDPRSGTDEVIDLARRKPATFRGLLGKVYTIPPIRVLHLDANAALPVEEIINSVASTLQHFSWRVPSLDHHPQLDNQVRSFYGMTSRLMQTLWRVPNLETLRMCISMRNLPLNSERYRRDMALAVEGLTNYLFQCPTLKHFELHQAGLDEFHRDDLIRSLPHGLQRLYLSDVTIPAARLVELVRTPYFDSGGDGEMETGQHLLPSYADIWTEEGDVCERGSRLLDHCLVASTIVVNGHGFVEYLTPDEANIGGLETSDTLICLRSTNASKDFLDSVSMLGEARCRQDYIPLNTGKIGFITFEYDDAHKEEDDTMVDPQFDIEESERTKIFKLNGMLLDREHNLHLAHTQDLDGAQCIAPKLTPDAGNQAESAFRSEHSAISQGLYTAAQLRHNDWFVKKMVQELDQCLDARLDWYFGNEDEAEEVFQKEVAADLDKVKQKSILVEVEVTRSSKCQWMSPDYDVPPVGSFPMPPLPHDWKDDL